VPRASHADLWSPLTIGTTTVKNRVLVTPHSPLYGEDHVHSDRHIAYYRERARGGVALIGTEQHYATRHGYGGYSRAALGSYDKRSIPRFAKLADTVHEYGCKMFVELAAAGVHDTGAQFIDDWHPVWGASRVPSIVNNEIPAVMDQNVIDEMIADFAQSAANVQIAGLDGVELHGTHGYLFQQFMSPVYNKRTDRYGGSPAKRCQLVLETAEAIRARVGDFTLGIRMSMDEQAGPLGVTQEQAEEQLDLLASSGLLDFFDISTGGYHSLHRAVPPMGSTEEGFLVSHAKRAKEIVGERARVFVVGRVRDLELAQTILQEGAADMVGMTRAHIADPWHVTKAREGRADEIVRCVGANECMSRVATDRGLICIMNPITGRERQWGQGTLGRADSPRRVVVAGGGPAGMKAAGVAASRGHDVVLFEADEELGGHLRLLSALPTREEWQGGIDNLRRPLERWDVDVRLGATASLEELDTLSPDAVVCATGSSWDSSGFSPLRLERDTMPGVEQDNVLDVAAATERALESPRALGDKVLIVDETGDYLPLGLADLLSAAGVSVEVVSRHMLIGSELATTFDMTYLFPRLVEAGVRLSAQHFVERIDGTSVEVYGIWGGPPRTEDDVDTVVLAMMRTPNDGLFEEARERFDETHRIGDALAPRRTAVAVYEGEKLGREL
jgi:2,4-dienoyl-CoA reductase-like NADH-dependent reductase (Old Yellow Enzyme family)